MAFDNFGITTKGFEMLAAATTGSLIQMVGGRCSQNTIAQANIPSATDSQFLSAPEGTLKAMSVTDTAAQIIIEFSNAGLQNAITLKSFCLRAMSQGSATAYPFAVCSLNNGGITLQPQSVTGVVVRFQVPFDLTFDGASTYIEGIPVGNNASVDMLDRFVSTHSVGDSAAGDAQTIQGKKTFSDEATFSSGLTARGTIESYDIMPYDKDDLGANGRRFGGVWAMALHGAIQTAKIENNTVTAELGAIMCIKRASPTQAAAMVGEVFLVAVPSSYQISSLDGQTFGDIPLGYYQVLSPRPSASSDTDTAGNKPFMVVYLGIFES
jgi:hypothetical protein